jgi:hypothetical protein
VKENLGVFAKLLWVLGSQVADGMALRAHLLDSGVALEIIVQTIGHIFALRHTAYAMGQVFQDFGHEQGIVGTTKDEGVNLWVKVHNLVDALLDKIVGTRGVGLVVLYKGDPEGTGDT